MLLPGICLVFCKELWGSSQHRGVPRTQIATFVTHGSSLGSCKWSLNTRVTSISHPTCALFKLGLRHIRSGWNCFCCCSLQCSSCSSECSEGRGPKTLWLNSPGLIWAQWDWKDCHWSQCPRAQHSSSLRNGEVQLSSENNVLLLTTAHGPVLYHLVWDALPEKQNRTLEVVWIFSC